MVTTRNAEFFDVLPSIDPGCRTPAGYWRGRIKINDVPTEIAYCEWGPNHGAGGIALGNTDSEDILIARWPWADTWLRVPAHVVREQMRSMTRAADMLTPGTILSWDDPAVKFHDSLNAIGHERGSIEIGPWDVRAGAISLPAPAWAPDAEVWRGRGGIVIGFGGCIEDAPHGERTTYAGTRHIRRARDWFLWPHGVAASGHGRQGDVFVVDWFGSEEGLRSTPVKEGAALDRHVVVLRNDGALVLEHPEHEPMTFVPPREPGEDCLSPLYLVMLPGRSRPGSTGGD